MASQETLPDFLRDDAPSNEYLATTSSARPSNPSPPYLNLTLLQLVGKERKRAYMPIFFFLHIAWAIVLIGMSCSIFFYGILQDHPVRHYWTISALDSTTVPVPGVQPFFSRFEIVHEASFWWVFIVPLCAGFYHLMLALPNFFTVYWVSDPDRKYRKANNTYIVFWLWQPSAFFYKWYDVELSYGTAGSKHFYYGLSYSSMVVMVAVLVGVTDLLLLVYTWVLPFIGYWTFWNIHHSQANTVRLMMDKDDDTSLEIGDVNESVLPTSAAEAVEMVRDQLKHVPSIYSRLFLAFFSILMTFALLITYFAIMVSRDSSNVPGSVYFAFIYFLVETIIYLLLTWGWHHGYEISKNHYTKELIISIVFGLGFATTSAAAFFELRDFDYLYGLSPSP